MEICRTDAGCALLTRQVGTAVVVTKIFLARASIVLLGGLLRNGVAFGRMLMSLIGATRTRPAALRNSAY
jgi:hypothetical protein